MVGRRVNYFAVQSIWKITPPPSPKAKSNRVLGVVGRFADSFYGLPYIIYQYKCVILLVSQIRSNKVRS